MKHPQNQLQIMWRKKRTPYLFSLTCPRRLRVAWKYAELAPTIISRAQITWIPIIGKKVWHQAQSFFFVSVKSKSYLCHSALNMEWRGGLGVEEGGRTRCCWSEMCLECIGYKLMLIKCLQSWYSPCWQTQLCEANMCSCPRTLDQERWKRKLQM